MYPYSHLPKPLPTRVLYVLVALAQRELHVYGLIGAILNDSLGSVRVSPGQLYPLVRQLHEEGLIELVDAKRYRLAELGRIRLQEEFVRLKQLMEIGQAAGLMDNGALSPDLQRLLLSVD